MDNRIKTFEQWCADNGKRWIGCADYAEFSRNADAYEAYRIVRLKELADGTGG